MGIGGNSRTMEDFFLCHYARCIKREIDKLKEL